MSATQDSQIATDAAGAHSVHPLVGPLSPQLQRLFPKLCKPRKPHQCRLCGHRIDIGEPCCRWEYLEPGEGYGTSYAHPECYQVTIDGKWDDGDWECCMPGDVSRPND